VAHCLTPEQAGGLQNRHAAAYEHYRAKVLPLPGARELMRQLDRADVPFAIATSGDRDGAQPASNEPSQIRICFSRRQNG
jgi:phosphoglycolate phosphatase-like HAD superfamily hydrolase